MGEEPRLERIRDKNLTMQLYVSYCFLKKNFKFQPAEKYISYCHLVRNIEIFSIEIY